MLWGNLLARSFPHTPFKNSLTPILKGNSQHTDGQSARAKRSLLLPRADRDHYPYPLRELFSTGRGWRLDIPQKTNELSRTTNGHPYRSNFMRLVGTDVLDGPKYKQIFVHNKTTGRGVPWCSRKVKATTGRPFLAQKCNKL